jgi:hypothetical protein
VIPPGEEVLQSVCSNAHTADRKTLCGFAKCEVTSVSN